MTILRRIDSDYKSLRFYFEKMFALLEEVKVVERKVSLEAEDFNSTVSTASFHRVSHFIKPDMLLNVYSFLDCY